MYTIVHYSPTGNAAYIAKLLSHHIEDSNVYALEHTAISSLPASEHLILLFAIHAFNAPGSVKRFVENMVVDQFKKVSLIGVGCNTSWINLAASKEIRRIVEGKSCEVIVDELIAMPLTFIMSFPEDVIEEQIATAKASIKVLAEVIRNSTDSSKAIPFKSHLINAVGKVEPFAARLFGLELHAKKSCIQCGLCVRECPVGNIRMDDKGKIKFGFKCTMCMRCIYKCPTQSITPRLSKFIPIKKGYSLDAHLPSKGKE